MTHHSLFVASVLLAVSVLRTQAQVVSLGQIGVCNNTLVSEIMDKNALYCPIDLFQTVQKLSPYLKIRVVPKVIADTASCATALLEDPINNTANFTFYITTVDTPSRLLTTRFSVAEARCGLVFKHIVAEQHASFKLAFIFTDGITLGYYGCSNDAAGRSEDVTYGICLASTYLSDVDIVNASLERCRDEVARVTGTDQLVILPDCDNQ